jgi:hypothetical protein
VPVLAAIVVAAGVLHPAAAAAQERTGRIQFGPLGLSPALRIPSIGFDNNVLNDPDNRQEDFTVVVSPEVQTALNAVGTRVRGSSGVSFVYFKELSSQRSINVNNALRWEVPLHRFLPYVSYSIADLRSRPNQEIDAPVQHHLSTIAIGTDVKLGPWTTIGFHAQRGRTSFEDNAVYLNTNLSEALDRTAETVGASWRYDLTPVTRLSVIGDVQQDSFDVSTSRSAKIYGFRPSLEFAPTALLKGAASVGFKRFDIDNELVDDYSGLIASVDLSYTLRDAARFGVRLDRDVAYSFSDLAPYYVQTGLTVSLMQQFWGRWDVTASASRQWQDYRTVDAPGSALEVSLLEPKGALYGYQLGLGHRLGGGIRLGFSVDYSRRSAGLRGEYEATRAMSSITYEP